jgi:hypothetical protein
MHHDFAQQPTGQIPPIAGPDALDQAACHEPTEDRVHAVAQPSDATGKQGRGSRVAQRYGESLARPCAHSSWVQVGCQ